MSIAMTMEDQMIQIDLMTGRLKPAFFPVFSSLAERQVFSDYDVMHFCERTKMNAKKQIRQQQIGRLYS